MKEKEFRDWLGELFEEYRYMYREALEKGDFDKYLVNIGKANLIMNVIMKFEEVFCDEEG